MERVNYKYMNMQDIINEIRLYEKNNLNFFLEALDDIKSKNKDTNTMVELGCETAHYSALFNEKFNNQCKNIVVEPVIEWYQRFGEKYFQDKKNIYFYNNYIGEILWAGWGGQNDQKVIDIKSKVNQISFNQILSDSNTDYIDILHMDMQGTEYFILKEIIENNLIEKTNYIFIMTHSFDNINYNSYLDLMRNNLSHKILFNDPSYRENGDGLIILKNKNS